MFQPAIKTTIASVTNHEICATVPAAEGGLQPLQVAEVYHETAGIKPQSRYMPLHREDVGMGLLKSLGTSIWMVNSLNIATNSHNLHLWVPGVLKFWPTDIQFGLKSP